MHFNIWERYSHTWIRRLSLVCPHSPKSIGKQNFLWFNPHVSQNFVESSLKNQATFLAKFGKEKPPRQVAIL